MKDLVLLDASTALRLQCIAKELASFLDKDYSQILDTITISWQYIEQEWHSNLPISEEDIFSFYVHSEPMLYDNCRCAAGSSKEVFYTLLDVCILEKIHTILEFGGGVGQYALLLGAEGYEVTFCELGPSYQFAMHRFQTRHLNNVRGLNLANVYPLRVFDSIVCTDVLEHMPNPQRIIDFFYASLKAAGLLFLNIGRNIATPLHLFDNLQVDLSAFVLVRSLKGLEIWRKP